MAKIGIIAEFNPLHTGHKLLIDTAKAEDNTLVCVLSGNFVQRGDTAILPKQKRTEAALRAGADLVAELPVLWSMSTAQNFALGGVAQLARLCCDEILFGSECGDIDALLKTAEILSSSEFSIALADELKKGITFAAARENAAVKLGLKKEILNGANNNLGIEYILAAKKLNLDIKFSTIKRVGAAHDSLIIGGKYVSASLIRNKILEGDLGFADKYIPLEARGILTSENVSDIKRIEKAILAVLRTKTKEDFANLPDISEGLENKLYIASRISTSLEELYDTAKSKRYTLARIRRLLLSAFLGFDNSFFLKPPPYVRVLGLNDKGAKLLSEISDKRGIVTKATEIKALGEYALKVFETESRATDLYSLSLNKPTICGNEFTAKFLKAENLL